MPPEQICIAAFMAQKTHGALKSRQADWQAGQECESTPLKEVRGEGKHVCEYLQCEMQKRTWCVVWQCVDRRPGEMKPESESSCAVV